MQRARRETHGAWNVFRSTGLVRALVLAIGTVIFLLACASQRQTPTVAIPSPTPPRPVPFTDCQARVEEETWGAAASACSLFLEQHAVGEPLSHHVRARVGLGTALWHLGGPEKASAAGHFRRAVELVDEGGAAGEGREARHGRYRGMLGADEQLVELIDAIAKARFYLGEEVRERFEAREFPAFEAERELPRVVRFWWRRKQGPDKAREWEQMIRFLPPDERHKQMGSIQFQYWAQQRFGPWMSHAAESLAEATKLYTAVAQEGAPEWEMAAAARVGSMSLSMAQALDTAPIDPSIEGDAELVAIYRDALGEQARAFHDRAAGALEHCLELARVNELENQWSRQCAKALDLERGSPLGSKGGGIPPSGTTRPDPPPQGPGTSP